MQGTDWFDLASSHLIPATSSRTLIVVFEASTIKLNDMKVDSLKVFTLMWKFPIMYSKANYMYGCDMMIGASLNKPHIDHDNGPRAQNNGMSVSMYRLPCVCHTLAPEICVRLENACLRVWFTTALNQRRYDTRISPYRTSITIAICCITNCNWVTVRYACRTSSGTEHWPA